MNKLKTYKRNAIKFPAVIFIVAFVLYSCSGTGSNRNKKGDAFTTEVSALIDTLNNLNNKKLSLDDYTRLLVIPVDTGCDMCIQKSLYRSLVANNGGEKYMVIMAATKPAVLLSVVEQLALSGPAYNNALTDTSGVLERNGFLGREPCLFIIEMGTVKDSVHINYANIDNKIPE